MRTLTVNTPSNAYPIYIGHDLLQQAGDLLSQHLTHRVAIISNETVAPLYLKTLEQSLDTARIPHFSIILPDGEKYKNWPTLMRIFDGLLEHKAERKTTLIALGGGVIGDITGFAAATYQRGAPFIQIPTTLLSQVDSSVGGKTAINHPLGKNMIGAFYQPQAVLADLGCLQTLPAREFSAGLAEVVKYALLGDVKFLAWLENFLDNALQQEPETLTEMVYHCCQMKADIVAADEKESGIRAWLNLGHTFAHAIEAKLGFGTWLHGEAVGVGMVLAAELSRHLGYLQAAEVERISALLSRAQLPVAPPVMPLNAWLQHMQHDKKVEDGKLRFIVLKALGRAHIENNIAASTLQKTLQTWLPATP